MVAKPVIDIIFGVKSLEESKPAIEVLEKSDYEYWPYKADAMHWFCKPSDAFRTHHLHLVPFEGVLWRQRIKFRELLRSDEKLAATYPNDRETYTKKKSPFIQNALQEHLGAE